MIMDCIFRFYFLISITQSLWMLGAMGAYVPDIILPFQNNIPGLTIRYLQSNILATSDTLNLAAMVSECIRTLPDQQGDIQALKIEIRECSIKAWQKSLETNPNDAQVKEKLKALQDAQAKDRSASPKDCSSSNSLDNDDPIQNFNDPLFTNCLSTLRECVSNTKMWFGLDKRKSFVGLNQCISQGHLCRTRNLGLQNKTSEADLASLMVDQTNKLILAYTGNQTCSPTAKTKLCAFYHNCRSLSLVQAWFGLDTTPLPPKNT